MTTNEILGSSASGGAIASQTKQSSTIMQDEFLKLLTYQLKSQNPLNPMDNQEFASQLAQFSQLEELSSIRSLMESQVQSNLILTQTIANSALPGLLGKTAKAISNKIFVDGEKPSSLGYSLPYSAVEGKILIKDDAGNLVNQFELYEFDLKRGNHDLTWNGQDNKGNNLPVGEYSFEVVATDSSGVSFTADTYNFGKIESIRFKSEGTFLLVNGIEIALENIMDISTSDYSFVDAP